MSKVRMSKEQIYRYVKLMMKLLANSSKRGKDAVRDGCELEGIKFIRTRHVWIKKCMCLIKMKIVWN